MPDIEALRKTVFFVTPIGSDASEARERSDDIMDLLLAPVVAELDPELKVIRADKLAAHGRITDKIVQHLLHSAIVVVDVTGLNPNVLYELGVAHAFHRPVVLIVDEPNAIPFDTRSEAHVVLPGGAALAARSVADCRPKLFEALREAQSATVPPGPVAAAEAQLIAPEISGSEAAELLMSTIAELSARLESLEAVAPRFRASESPVTTSTRTIAGRQRALGATGADSLGLQPGDFVFHPKWGVGQVVVVVGTGDRAEAGVTFETVGEKRLNLSLAPIRRYNPEAETEVYGNEAE